MLDRAIRSDLSHLILAAVIPALLVVGIRSSSTQGAFDVTPFVQGLNQPTSMAFAPDGRLFVAEKGGTLRVVTPDGTLRPTPFLALSVSSGTERGLLSVAFDPAFATNRYLYVFYSLKGVYFNRVSRFTADSVNPDNVVAGSELIILDNIPAAGNHNGGALHFGPDSKLYVATGDTKDSALAQSLDSLAGKILRIDPSAHPNIVPPDNPFVQDPTARREVWALGLRNPYTFAIDSTGRMLINDVGQSTWEEMNPGQAGANYGWPTCEGPQNTGVGNCSSATFVYPTASIRHADGQAITGGVFYEADQFPAEYRDNYFFSDYAANWIRRLTPTNQVIPFLNAGSPVDLDVDAAGNLYYASFGDGAIYRVQYATGNADPAAAFNAVPASGPAPLSVTFDAAASTDADGDALSYAWNFGDGANASGVVVSHTYNNAGSYVATLTVTDGRGGDDVATRVISAGQPPTGSITAPMAGALYSAGETIGFEGMANDPEDGALPASAFSWTIVFHHDSHTHPFAGPIDGVTSGTFAIPDNGEESANVWYRIHLTVRDSSGLTHQATRDVLPRVSNVTLQAQPAGIQLTLDGQPVNTPYAFATVVGMRREIGAPAASVSGGTQYQYSSWSDGGARVHEIVSPAANTTYTAQFTPVIVQGQPRAAYLEFDGAGDHMGVPASQDVGEGGAITVSAWIRPAANGMGMYIATKGRSGFQDWMLRRIQSNNAIAFNVRNQSGTLVAALSPNNFANDLAWHHVAGVFDGATVSLYVDGSRATTTSAALAGPIQNGPTSICIGALSSGGDACGSSSTFFGGIDDVRIWNRALSEQEIQATMNTELAGGENGLTAYWPMNDGGGQVAGDRSAGAHPGRVGTSSLVDVNDPAWVSSAADVTPPAATLTSPGQDASLTGTVNLTADASDDTGVAGVQFQVNGQPIGAEDGTAPYATTWNTTTYPNGTYSLTARARDAEGNASTSPAVTVTVDNMPADATPPAVDITSPAPGAIVSGTAAVAASASDNVGVVGVQFTLDGVNLGPEDVTAPFSINWDTTQSSNAPHTISAMARDAAGNSATSAGVSVTVDNAGSPPVISNVTMTSITSDGGTVNWATDTLSDSQIEYGVTASYGSFTALDTTMVTAHSRTLTGLQPSTTYHFRVRSRDAGGRLAVSGDETFTTQAASPGSGPRSQYLAFDGAGDRVAIPYSADSGEGNAITVSAWIRFSANNVGMHIVTKGKSGTEQWTLRRVQSNNKIVFNVRNSSGTLVAAGSPNGFGTDLGWHHIAGVYDGTHVYLYLDGDRTSSTSAALTGAIRNDVHSICIGALDPGSGDCGSSSTFRGDIDDVRIYNRALTQQEILQTMDVELAGNEPGLTGYWKFNEGVDQSAFDSSPSLLHGVLGTTLGVESSDPAWVSAPSAWLDLDSGWPPRPRSTAERRMAWRPAVLAILTPLRRLEPEHRARPTR